MIQYSYILYVRTLSQSPVPSPGHQSYTSHQPAVDCGQTHIRPSDLRHLLQIEEDEIPDPIDLKSKKGRTEIFDCCSVCLLCVKDAFAFGSNFWSSGNRCTSINPGADASRHHVCTSTLKTLCGHHRAVFIVCSDTI